MEEIERPEKVLAKELGDRETLLWCGRPRQGVFLRRADIYLIPFSLLWGGFAIFWEYTVLTSKAPVFFGLWGVPFVLVGLYLIFGRFVGDARQRARTYYGLTDQRILILSGLFGRTVKSLNLRTLADVSLSERPDGSGTITFGPLPPFWAGGQAGWPGTGRYTSPSFELAEKARDVFDRIRTAQTAADAPGRGAP
jgi:hypothetical protein